LLKSCFVGWCDEATASNFEVDVVDFVAGLFKVGSQEGVSVNFPLMCGVNVGFKRDGEFKQGDGFLLPVDDDDVRFLLGDQYVCWDCGGSAVFAG
jgi:hypothetical protein